MSTPTEDRDTPGGSAPAPTVSTAPAAAAAPRWWSAIPSHLGRARTSTVVLALLFVAIFALWLQVKPAETATVPTGVGTVQQQPAAPMTEAPAPAPATTTAPPTTDEPEPTTEDETTTTPSTPTTSSPAPTTTEAPEVTDEPAPTTPTGPTGGAGATAPTTP